MVRQLDPDDMTVEQERELRAAYGDEAVDNGRIIELEEEELEEVETPDFKLKYILEEGDWVTVQHQSGNVTTGPVTEVKEVGFNMEPQNRTASGYFAYGDFKCEGTDDRGVVNELIDINGEPSERVIEERGED